MRQFTEQHMLQPKKVFFMANIDFWDKISTKKISKTHLHQKRNIIVGCSNYPQVTGIMLSSCYDLILYLVRLLETNIQITLWLSPSDLH